MNTPETKEIFQLYRMGAAMTWELEPLVAAIEIRRDEAEKQLRELVEVCNEYGGGAKLYLIRAIRGNSSQRRNSWRTPKSIRLRKRNKSVNQLANSAFTHSKTP